MAPSRNTSKSSIGETDAINDAKLECLFKFNFSDIRDKNPWIDEEWGADSGRDILDNLAIDWNSSHKGMGVSGDLKNWILDQIDEFQFTDEEMKTIQNAGKKEKEVAEEVAKPAPAVKTVVHTNVWSVGDKVSGNDFSEGIIREVFDNGSLKICYSDESKAYNWITLTKDEAEQLMRVAGGASRRTTALPAGATGTLADLLGQTAGAAPAAATANDSVEVKTATGWIDRKIKLNESGLVISTADGSKELMTLSLTGLTVKRSPGVVQGKTNVFSLSMSANSDPALDVYMNGATAMDADQWVSTLNAAITKANPSPDLPPYKPNGAGEPEPNPTSDASSVYGAKGAGRSAGDLLDDQEFPIGTEVVCSFPTKKSKGGFFGTGKLKMDITLKGRVVGYTGGLLLVMIHGEAKPRRTHRSWVHKKKLPAHLVEQDESAYDSTPPYGGMPPQGYYQEDFMAPPVYGERMYQDPYGQGQFYQEYHDPAAYRVYEPPRVARPPPVQEQVVYHQPQEMYQQPMYQNATSVVAPASHRQQDAMAHQGVSYHPSVRQTPYPDSFAQPDLPSWA